MTAYDHARDALLDTLVLHDWTRQISGEVEAPTGYFYALDLTGAEDIAQITRDFPELVEGVDLSTLAGFYFGVVDSNGFCHIWECSTADEMHEAFERREAEYAEWLGADDEAYDTLELDLV